MELTISKKLFLNFTREMLYNMNCVYSTGLFPADGNFLKEFAFFKINFAR